MFFVYRLLDYKKFPFYIGITKNLAIRIKEHTQGKNATPAKVYRTRRCIKEHGTLLYTSEAFETKAEALIREEELIKQFEHQLVNKNHGKVKKEGKLRRSKGRSKQCPTCGNWYKRLGSHKCQDSGE